jgi:SAM-dependent methyltransferase
MGITSPVPPPELAARVGGAYADYLEIGRQHRALLDSLLPADWSFAEKVVLDFGCGPGRTLSAFAAEAEHGEFVGCDIHAGSIEWASANLSPPFEFFMCGAVPPLDQPDERFDLVYAFSVFTHITDHWSEWLAELHRVTRPGGLAIVSVLGPAMSREILGRAFDDRIGMAKVDLYKDWSIGGPNVLLSEWWVREHWGRAFEIVRYEPCDPAAGAGHDLVLMARRPGSVSPFELARTDLGDPRELAAIQCNLELLSRQHSLLSDDAIRLVGPRGALPRDIERPLLALATHPIIGGPVFAALRAGYRAGHAARRSVTGRSRRSSA